MRDLGAEIERDLRRGALGLGAPMEPVAGSRLIDRLARRYEVSHEVVARIAVGLRLWYAKPDELGRALHRSRDQRRSVRQAEALADLRKLMGDCD